MTVDSIKMTGDSSIISNYSLDMFTRDQSQKQDAIIKDVYRTPENLKTGLKNITLDNLYGRFTVELSAKILGADYFDNININNIEKVIDEINSTGVIEIRKSKVSDIGVCRIDICDNVEVEKTKQKYFKALTLFKFNEKFDCNTNHKGSIIFESKKKTVSDRITLYDKKRELGEAKNRDLVEKLVESNNLKKFDNVIRVEQNLKSFEAMRKHIGVKTTKENGANLIDILQSQTKSNFNLLNTIVEEPPPLLFRDERFEGMSLHQIERHYGVEKIIILCEYDLEKVFEFIRQRVKGNIIRYKRDYQEAYQRMMRDANMRDHYEIDNCISEILNKLA